MSSDCMRLVVVAVTMLLSETCQTVHNVSISHDVLSGRQRRQAETVNQNVVVYHHNALRAVEGAANMELMAWSRTLASNAASHAKRCTFEHDHAALGQNIAGGGNPKNLTKKIDIGTTKKHTTTSTLVRVLHDSVVTTPRW